MWSHSHSPLALKTRLKELWICAMQHYCMYTWSDLVIATCVYRVCFVVWRDVCVSL